ncbi:MAG: phospholipase A, partial [Burkholderiaceae bacterium]
MSPSFLRFCALLCVTAANPGVSFAQTPPPATPADCHRIADNAERLVCYDTTSGRTASGRPVEPVASPSKTAPPAQAEVTNPTSPPATTSIIDENWNFDPKSAPYDISFYHANYLLLGRYSSAVNTAPFSPLFNAAGRPDEELSSTEAKFQISFKARVWTTEDRRWGVWAAYTQQSQWQLYNGDESRPFRDTNYMP